MTTSFVPLDELDGSLTMQVADIVAFTVSSEIQNSFCSKLAFHALAYPEDVLCTFKVTDNVSSTLLEASGRFISDQAQLAEEKHLEQFGGASRTPQPGGITVDFIMNIPDVGINETLAALKAMNMTVFIDSVTEDIHERGLQAPAMEIAALFVDGLKTNIAEPPQPLRLAFGDNVTKWSPEEVASGGPPTQPPPWIVADEVAHNATVAATVAAASAANASANASASTTTNATQNVVQTDPSIVNNGGTPAPTPQAVISPAKTDVEYKNDATNDTSSGVSGATSTDGATSTSGSTASSGGTTSGAAGATSGTTSGAAATTSGTTAGATGTASGTTAGTTSGTAAGAAGTTSGTAPTPAPVTTTVNMAAGGPAGGLGGAPPPPPPAATAATAATATTGESPQAGAKRCASMGLMVQILIGTLFSTVATAAM